MKCVRANESRRTEGLDYLILLLNFKKNRKVTIPLLTKYLI